MDPFNNHGTGIKNKENVYKMTKLLSEINREAQNQIIEHRQTGKQIEHGQDS